MSSEPSLKPFRHAQAGQPFDLHSIDPGTKPFSLGKKAADQARVEELAIDLDGLQNLLWADARHKLLVVLQGTDTSGKDGTLRGVFGRMSPLGVRTVAWKAPTEEERARDFLWRRIDQRSDRRSGRRLGDVENRRATS